MLQQHEPRDYVVATGVDHTIRDFCRVAFEYVDLDWNEYVTVDESLFRPAEVHILRGDPTKAKAELGWTPDVSFEELVTMMVDRDMDLTKSEA